MLDTRRVALTLVWILLANSVLHADVLPRGMKSVGMKYLIDFGSMKDISWSVHIVKKGESLSSIAKNHFGKDGRVDELIKANPTIKPKLMRPGTRVELPPKKKDAPGKGWRFYWFSGFNKDSISKKIVGPGFDLGYAHYSGMIAAVPHEHKEAFEKAIDGERRGRWERVKELKFVHVSKRVSTRRNVKIADPTKTIELTMTIAKVAGGQVELKTTERKLGANGRALTWSEQKRLPILAASGVGLLLFGGILMRRKKLQVVEA